MAGGVRQDSSPRVRALNGRALGRGTLLVLATLSAVGPIGTDLYIPGLPAIASDLSTSAAAAQLTVTGFLLGLALGQLLAGPLGDRTGRRSPIIWSTVGYGIVAVACALAPNVALLASLRLLQGLLGAVGLVLARAWVRDVSNGATAARTYALLAVVSGVVPVLAPIVGGQILLVGSWRLVFWCMAALAVVTLILVLLFLPESLPLDQRRPWRRQDTDRRVLPLLWADRTFLAGALAMMLMGGTLFAYIGGSPFVLQHIYGLNEQQYSLAFALNAFGIVSLSVVSQVYAERIGLARLLVIGLAISAVGGVLLVIAVALDLALPWVLLALLLAVAPVGLANPNATAIALARHGDHAGTASGILGVCQFGLAIVTAPLTGIGGSDTALPLAVVIATLMIAAVIFVPLLLRGQPVFRHE